MADYTREEIEELAAWHETLAERIRGSGRSDADVRKHNLRAAALRAYTAGLGAEPVAWQWLMLDGWKGQDGTTEEYARAVAGPHGRVRAIYTAPVAAVPTRSTGAMVDAFRATFGKIMAGSQETDHLRAGNEAIAYVLDAALAAAPQPANQIGEADHG